MAEIVEDRRLEADPRCGWRLVVDLDRRLMVLWSADEKRITAG